VPIVEEELIEYIIDGIPDHALRNQASWQFWQVLLMSKLFEQVSYRTRNIQGRRAVGKNSSSGWRRTEVMKAERASKRRGTASIAAPIISVKTVRRRRRDQSVSSTVSVDLISKCIEQSKVVNDINIVTRSGHKKYVKEISINDQKIETLIDSGYLCDSGFLSNARKIH